MPAKACDTNAEWKMIQTQGSFRDGLRAGDRAVYTRTFTESDVALFGGLTGDMNPYHFDGEFARAGRFGRPIVHGLLVGSMMTHVGGQWAWLASSMSFRFIAPVFVGDTITLEMTIVERDEHGRCRAEARFLKPDGSEVLRGELDGFPPPPEEIARLARAELLGRGK
jgi:acyl dehydratase